PDARGVQCRAYRRQAVPGIRRRRGVDMRTSYIRVVATALMLASCADTSMKPYQAPALPAKSAWSNSATLPLSRAELIVPDWWRGFGDPTLDQLIGRAISGNFDLAVLAARIGVASEQIGEARAGALPT